MLKTRMALFVMSLLAISASAATTCGQTGGGGGGTGGGGGIGGGGGAGGGGAGGGGAGGGGAGGGGAGGDFNQQQLSLGGNDFEFANIRQVRFAGVSRTYAIHPFTRVGQNAPILTQGNVDGGATGAPARTTQANTTQAGGVTGFNAFNSPFGQFAQFGRGGFGGLGGFGAQQQAPVRSSLTFNPPPPPPGLAPAGQSVNSPISSPTLGARVRSIPGLANAEVNVSLLNRTAIVSGLVTSEEEKERIGRVLKLEPGVSEIDNRLQVQR